MSLKIKSRMKKSLVVVVVALITLLYWEMGVRFLGTTAFPLLRTDPEVGSIHVKNYSGLAWDVNSGRKNFIRTNSEGYVGEDVPFERSPNTIRIAMLGDSTLAGLQVDYIKNFASLLEERLSTARVCGKDKFEVMNFGVGSAGTFLEYQTYTKKVIPFHPDYVFVIFHDDYGDDQAKLGYSLDNYAAERRAVGLKSFLLQFQLPKLIFSKLKNNEVVLWTLKKLGVFEIADGSANSALGVATTSIPDTHPKEYYEYTFEIIDRLRERVEESGSHFVVVLFPREVDLSGGGKWKESTSTVAMLGHLRDAGIAYVNPADEMAAAKKAGGGACLSFSCGDHLNEAGHRVMAEVLYEDMASRLTSNKALCPTQR